MLDEGLVTCRLKVSLSSSSSFSSLQECRMRKNFSSLRAIVSALQSNPLYRLKRAWACVHK